jgi:hypothetical protein
MSFNCRKLPSKLPAHLRLCIVQSKYNLLSYQNYRRVSSKYYFDNKEIKELKQLTELEAIEAPGKKEKFNAWMEQAPELSECNNQHRYTFHF